MDSKASTELELINNSRNSEIEVLENSPPDYAFEWATETKAQLVDPQNKTFEELAHSIRFAIESIRTEVSCQVHKASDHVPPIKNVDDFQGYQKTFKVRVGDLIISYHWKYIGN